MFRIGVATTGMESAGIKSLVVSVGLVVSACFVVSAIFRVESFCANTNDPLQMRNRKKNNLYANTLVNAHIHLVQQLVELFYRIIIKSYLAAAIFAVLHFNPCAEMGGQFILHFFIAFGKCAAGRFF